jgi:hypothetical protein
MSSRHRQQAAPRQQPQRLGQRPARHSLVVLLGHQRLWVGW